MNRPLLPALTDKELADTLGSAMNKEQQLITISGKCHMSAPLVVIFEVGSSSLLLVCQACGQMVARIAVEKSAVH